MKSPIQKILFGSPGTGKSHRIKSEIIPNDLGIDESQTPENVIKTVFHPEYTYSDFMGKLVPLTTLDRKVEYKFYEGHFLKALAQAYKNILSTQDGEEVKNVALVIDEINRGNSSAIFGTVFQLLDRNENGWSDYGINLSDLELRSIVSLIGFNHSGTEGDLPTYKYEGKGHAKTLEKHQDIFSELRIAIKNDKIIGSCIRIPPNLSIIGTMNTSDNSIYFMDSAFKRRWNWEFVNWDKTHPPDADYGELDETQWETLIKNINEFIKKQHDSIRGIEDKQIGYYFIKPPVTTENIQNKLMFFLWDSVFNRDKQPLVRLLDVERNDLVTFGDFTKLHNKFITKINAGEWREWRTKP
ncbi:McrB family protein [Laspinema olomoucense]|uniref:McrB family protein n=1 Tax=Laspinema olomoucense TaxID=3231600 RepID=UPI0021BB67AB|nr:restriction endonuclease [Laspinema sp. D3d]MCT7970491.1 restriction endonuclease [Laspinema sp. D3d]